MVLNEWMNNLINLPIQFGLLVGSFYFLINQKPSIKTIIVSIILIFIPSVILYEIVYWGGILYLIMGLGIFFSMYRENRKWLLYLGTIIIIAVIADHLATTIAFSLPIKNELSRLLFRTVTFICIHVLFIIFISKIFNRFKFKIPTKATGFITLIILCTLIICYYNIFLTFKHTSIEALKLNTIFFTLYFFILVILSAIIIQIYYEKYQLKMKEKERENFEEYILSLEKVNKDMQKFRHDYLNILISMRGYIIGKDWVGLEDYFEKDILNFERRTLENNKILGNLNNIKDPAIKGLLFNKVSNALENNLNVSLEVPFPVNSNGNIIDLTRILGILIDNAIENCVEDHQKSIQIAIIKEQGVTLFVIRNEINDRVININEMFSEEYTTKAEGRGLGLSIVKKIVSSSSNLSINVSIEEGWFTVELFSKE